MKYKTLATRRKEALEAAGIKSGRLVRTTAVAWKIQPKIKSLIDELSLTMSVEQRVRVSMADVFEDAVEHFARTNYPELAERHLAERAEDTTDAG